jgi:integral membrane sensor domain MASE1
MSTFLRVVLFSLASNAAVLFVLKFGQIVWPEGLPAHSQNAFWLASGVNLAGLLILGLRFWPIIILDAFPAWLIAGESLELTLIGSTTNALESLLAAWFMLRVAGFTHRFERVRDVGMLLLASFFAPLINTLIIPAWFAVRGIIPWSAYPEALGHWNLANGASILMITPLALAILRGPWVLPARRREIAAFIIIAAPICAVAFNALFAGANLNISFLVFPVVIYAAVRFGLSEVAAVLGMVLIAIYASMASHARAIPPDEMAATIWFAQAFCWVVAATGLLVAALYSERHLAKQAMQVERERSLEISLSEERARLEALRYQLSPHFLFNSLNSIYSTLPKDGAEIPRKMLTQLSGYLRSTLTTHAQDQLSLRQELLAMKQYLEVERHRFGDDLQVEISAEEPALNTNVPAFLLQPLIENAVVHGFAASRGIFRLEIRATRHDASLELKVSNTGNWIQREEGVGLANTRRRLNLLYGEEASLEVKGSEGWVRVHINLPIPQEANSRNSAHAV